MLNPPKLAGEACGYPSSVTTVSQNAFFLPLLTPSIAPSTLVHTLRAQSMSSLPLSYAHVLNHTEIYIETIVLCIPLEMLVPSFSIFPLSNLPTATKLHPIKLSLYFKIHFYSISTMWHSVCLDDLCPPLSRPPPVPPCCCFQDPRFLDPPCTYSPTLNITLPAGASSAFLRDHPDPGHARSGLSHDVLTPLRP